MKHVPTYTVRLRRKFSTKAQVFTVNAREDGKPDLGNLSDHYILGGQPYRKKDIAVLSCVRNPMTMQEALLYFKGESWSDGTHSLQFSDKEAAETYSRSLKAHWEKGIGTVLGPFFSTRKKKKTYEVVVTRELVMEIRGLFQAIA